MQGGQLGEGVAQVVEAGGHERAAGSSAPVYSNDRTRTTPLVQVDAEHAAGHAAGDLGGQVAAVDRAELGERAAVDDAGHDAVRARGGPSLRPGPAPCGAPARPRRRRGRSPSTCRTSPTAHTARTTPSAHSRSTACRGSIRTDRPPTPSTARRARTRACRCSCRRPTNTGSAVGRHPQPPSSEAVTNSDGKRDAATQDGGSAPPSSASRTGRSAGSGGLDVPGEHRPAVLPDDLVGEGLPAEHVPLRARAAGADAVVDHRPAAVRALDQVGVAGVLHRLVGAAVGEDRVARVALERPCGERPRAIVTACPRSVPPSAISRYHQSPIR